MTAVCHITPCRDSGGGPADGEELGAGDDDSRHAAVRVPKRLVAVLEEGVDLRCGVVGEVVANQVRHVGVVAELGGRMDVAAAGVAAEVAVEGRAHVV